MIHCFAALVAATVPLLMPHQKEYLDLPRDERVEKFADKAYRKAMARQKWYPRTVGISWSEVAGKGDYRVTVRRADGSVFTSFETGKLSAELDNLEIGTAYTWEAVRTGGATQTGAFETDAQAPRLLRVGGLYNTRDLGGRIGLGGRRIRQGMIMRSGGLNANAKHSDYTREEILAADADGSFHAEDARLERIAKDLEAVDPAAIRTVKADIGNVWRVTQEGETREITTDANGTYVFEKETSTNQIALACEFVSAEEGYALIGASADWYWELKLNGERIGDCHDGNHAEPKDAEAHRLPAHVLVGTNRIEVTLRRGLDGCVWTCRGLDRVEPTNFLAHAKRHVKEMRKTLFKVDSGRFEKGKIYLNEEGRRYLLDVFGLRTEIDLRSDRECWGMTGSPVGDSVRWVHIPSGAYAGMRSDFAKLAFAKVFRVFTDRRNYGIDFHCIAGQDRTGAVAFLLLGLLGVEEEELYRDWEATGFWNPSAGFCHARCFDKLVEFINTHEGATLNDRIYAYVKSCGITDEEIESFREIMLEPLPTAK